MSDDPVEPSIVAKYQLIANMWTDAAHIHGDGIRWRGYARELLEKGQPKLATLAENFAAWLELDAKELTRFIPTIE